MLQDSRVYVYIYIDFRGWGGGGGEGGGGEGGRGGRGAKYRTLTTHMYCKYCEGSINRKYGNSIKWPQNRPVSILLTDIENYIKFNKIIL